MLKMLWTGYRNEEWEKKFSEYCNVKFAGFSMEGQWGKWLSEDELIHELENVDVFLVGYDQITERVLESSPNLKLILSERDGPEENVDLKACEKLGIPVLNSAGRCTVSVAELTFNLLLNMSRPVLKINSWIRREKWTKENHQKLRDIVEAEAYEAYRKTLGIVGLGRNGRYLARLAVSFGMNVIAYDPYVDKQQVKDELNVEVMELDDVMRQSDFISILARVTPENHNLIGENQIRLMKTTAALINTGRPQLLDYQALAHALMSDKIRMAALDVFDLEPLGENSYIYDIPEDKLILTSHIAGFSRERAWHQCKTAFENFHTLVTSDVIQNNCTPKVQQSETFGEKGGRLLASFDLNGAKIL